MITEKIRKSLTDLTLLINSKDSNYYNSLLYKKLWITVREIKTDKVLGSKIFNFIVSKGIAKSEELKLANFINESTENDADAELLSSYIYYSLEIIKEQVYVDIEEMNENIKFDISILNDENFFDSEISEHRAECKKKTQELFKIIKEENELSEGEMRFIFGDNLDKDVIPVDFVTEYLPLLEKYLKAK